MFLDQETTFGGKCIRAIDKHRCLLVAREPAEVLLPETVRTRDYSIRIRPDAMSISLEGELIISGKAAERMRSLLVHHPEFYTSHVVPFIKMKEASFQPDELWIDADGRIHISNRRIAQRMAMHLPQFIRRALKR